MADIATLQAQLDKLQDTRSKGVLRLRMGDEDVTYRTDAELAAAISALERRIAAAKGQTVRTVRFTSSKGL
jgi:DNA-directed RNA polymerase sigma subunit (sigma70/sigma32)